ncbi:4-aminobutyrate aminotransferase [Monoraphidium neglectum]|uniref:4-aminobutyrate aminotransferase n=1 Tax=Monoraphidium neglectum TaxID=145388 RepID=A0A0D2K5N8_9CHLO|nr:4-aminobutyrate aminotransferase [Monoraphidium neglectum]KIZ05658.1 4-aminobutyrate aminotransferase [Monoraphidium neglectum]|eukprot:XP_013904677.1 4-aminobutyrate aminotransferase [Monoraphidium neglectum]
MSDIAAAAAKQLKKGGLQGIYRHMAAGLSKFNDVIITHGKGSWLYSNDGTKYLDMASGIGVTSTGHCHPRVVAAVQEQAGKIVHAQQVRASAGACVGAAALAGKGKGPGRGGVGGVEGASSAAERGAQRPSGRSNLVGAHEPMAALVPLLKRIMPEHLDSYFLCNSGSEAVDNAIKIARAATGRQGIIAFDRGLGPQQGAAAAAGGFHGRSIGAMALTSSKVVYRQHFGPLMPGVHIAQYPYCLHCVWQEAKGHTGYRVKPYAPPFSRSGRTCCNGPLESLEWMFAQQVHPSDVAAMIIEPILGEGGFLTPPPIFLLGLRELCDKHGILLIFDEVQSGVARSGEWWAHTLFDKGQVHPDLLVFAKVRGRVGPW